MKTLKNRILITLAFMAPVLATELHAQNTGVLGRKFSIHAGVNAGGYLDDYFQGNTEDEYYELKVGTRFSPTFAIDYACARKASVNFNYFAFKREFEVEDRYQNYAPKRFHLKANVSTISFKKYVGTRNSYIAPIGFYWGFMVSLVKVTVDDTYKWIYSSGGNISEDMYMMPGFQIGKHNIYFDRLVWDASMQLSVLPALPAGKDNNFKTLRDDVDHATEVTFRRTLLLNGRFTLGYLLF